MPFRPFGPRAHRRAVGTVHAVLRRASRLGLPYVWLLAIATGALVGLASVAFRIAIDAFQTLAYGADDAEIVQHLSDAPWWLFFAVPTGVGLLVGLLIQFGLPGGRAHGRRFRLVQRASRGHPVRA